MSNVHPLQGFPGTLIRTPAHRARAGAQCMLGDAHARGHLTPAGTSMASQAAISTPTTHPPRHWEWEGGRFSQSGLFKTASSAKAWWSGFSRGNQRTTKQLMKPFYRDHGCDFAKEHTQKHRQNPTRRLGPPRKHRTPQGTRFREKSQ